MEHRRPRWSVRISTLMLLVVIAALSVALFVEHQRRIAGEQRELQAEGRARLGALKTYGAAEQATARLHWALEKGGRFEARGGVTAKAMPNQLYRRCPECLDSKTRAPCSWCAGTGFVPTSLTLENLEHLLSQIRELRAAAWSLAIAIEEHQYLRP
jgi:hypothetical protein